MTFAFDNGSAHEARRSHRLDVSFHISGAISPSISFRLEPGQGLVCDPSAVLMQEDGVELRAWPGSGERLKLAVNAGGDPARLVLAAGGPGHIGAFELTRTSGRMLVARDALLAAGPGVAVAFHGRLVPGDDVHRRRPITIYRLEGAGWAFLRARGDVLEEEIGVGASLRVQAAAVVGLTAAVDFDGIEGMPSYLQLRGPGRAWLQSASVLDAIAVPAAGAGLLPFEVRPVA